MEYFFSKTIDESFDNAIQKVTEALKVEGFQEKVAGQVEVSAVDPVASMLSIENKDLQLK